MLSRVPGEVGGYSIVGGVGCWCGCGNHIYHWHQGPQSLNTIEVEGVEHVRQAEYSRTESTNCQGQVNGGLKKEICAWGRLRNFLIEISEINGTKCERKYIYFYI